jgi:hypothetical protein
MVVTKQLNNRYLKLTNPVHNVLAPMDDTHIWLWVSVASIQYHVFLIYVNNTDNAVQNNDVN